MASTNPKIQKKLGREVKGYIDSKWASVRYEIVLKGTIEKYKQNADLKSLLLATGDTKFVEASPYDKIWGVGMGADDPDITNPGKWRGKNLLGKAIDEAKMKIIKNESEHCSLTINN